MTKNEKNKYRSFMCTINFDQKMNPLEALVDFTKLRRIKAASFQLEVGPESKLLHWQVFLEFADGVTKWNIRDDVLAQGKQMHISDDWHNEHPCRGRNYVKKGPIIDGHRYTWSKAHGWGNNKQPPLTSKVTVPNIRQIEFDGTNINEVKKRLIEIREECAKYLKV